MYKKASKKMPCQKYFSIKKIDFLLFFPTHHLVCHICVIWNRYVELKQWGMFPWRISTFPCSPIRYFLNDLWLQRGDGLCTLWPVPAGSPQTAHGGVWRALVRLHGAVSQVLLLSAGRKERVSGSIFRTVAAFLLCVTPGSAQTSDNR